MCNKKIFLIFLIIIMLGILLLNFYNKEHFFDKAGIGLKRYGDIKYDLKGDPYSPRNVTNCYYDKRICYDNTFGDTERNTYGGRGLGRHN